MIENIEYMSESDSFFIQYEYYENFENKIVHFAGITVPKDEFFIFSKIDLPISEDLLDCLMDFEEELILCVYKKIAADNEQFKYEVKKELEEEYRSPNILECLDFCLN
jgi:hypothetical protein